MGDPAPDFVFDGATGTRQWLSDLRGAPAILAFHDPAWDPARADQIGTHRHLLASDAERPAPPVLVRNDDPAAAAFGVSGESAVFVIDGRGHIAWRHVSGLDTVSSAAEAAFASDRPPRDGETKNGWSRREFIATTAGAAMALTLHPIVSRAESAAATIAGGAPPSAGAPPAVGAAVPVSLTVNGQTLHLTLEPRVTLLDALREYAGLTGSKKGCDHGQCGACTVHVDGRRTLSCLTLAVMQQGKPITTIEGLAASAGAAGDALHPMQRAFIEHDGFQCGYCTSGQIMSASAVVHEPWGPSDDDVREAMSGNICRCGAYPGIVAAVQAVRQSGGASR